MARGFTLAGVVLLGGASLTCGDSFDAGGGGEAGTSAGSTASGTSSGSGTAAGTSSGSGGSAAAGGAGGGAVVHSDCAAGKIDEFVDDFGDESFVPEWQMLTGSSSRVQESGGELMFLPLANMPSGALDSIGTTSTFDLTECAVWIEIKETHNLGGPAAHFFGVYQTTENKLQIYVESDKISVEGAVPTGVLPETYDPNTDRYRLRETSSTVYFETSADDGVHWRTLDSHTSPPWLSSVHIQIGAGTTGSSPNPGIVTFDNLNLP